MQRQGHLQTETEVTETETEKQRYGAKDIGKDRQRNARPERSGKRARDRAFFSLGVEPDLAFVCKVPVKFPLGLEPSVTPI